VQQLLIEPCRLLIQFAEIMPKFSNKIMVKLGKPAYFLNYIITHQLLITNHRMLQLFARVFFRIWGRGGRGGGSRVGRKHQVVCSQLFGCYKIIDTLLSSQAEWLNHRRRRPTRQVIVL